MTRQEMTAAAEWLSEPPTESTKHMAHNDRVAGAMQMLADLHNLARNDGCIAAAWALEKLLLIAAAASPRD